MAKIKRKPLSTEGLDLGPVMGPEPLSTEGLDLQPVPNEARPNAFGTAVVNALSHVPLVPSIASALAPISKSVDTFGGELARGLSMGHLQQKPYGDTPESNPYAALAGKLTGETLPYVAPMAAGGKLAAGLAGEAFPVASRAVGEGVGAGLTTAGLQKNVTPGDIALSAALPMALGPTLNKAGQVMGMLSPKEHASRLIKLLSRPVKGNHENLLEGGASVADLGKIKNNSTAAANIIRNQYQTVKNHASDLYENHVFKPAEAAGIDGGMETPLFNKENKGMGIEWSPIKDDAKVSPKEVATFLSKKKNKDIGVDKIKEIMSKLLARKKDGSDNVSIRTFQRLLSNKKNKVVSQDELENFLSSRDSSRVVTKGLEKFPELRGKYEDFKNNPNLRNSHELQSELGKESASLASSSDGNDRRLGYSLGRARTALKKDVGAHLEDKDPKIGAAYDIASHYYHTNVVPYFKIPRKILSGEDTNPTGFSKHFKDPDMQLTNKNQGDITSILNVLKHSDNDELSRRILLDSIKEKVGSVDTKDPGALLDKVKANVGFHHYVDSMPEIKKELETLGRKTQVTPVIPRGRDRTILGAGAMGAGMAGFYNPATALGAILLSGIPGVGRFANVSRRAIGKGVSKLGRGLSKRASKSALAALGGSSNGN